jgi:hypothetical protein
MGKVRDIVLFSNPSAAVSDSWTLTATAGLMLSSRVEERFRQSCQCFRGQLAFAAVDEIQQQKM